MSPKSPGAVIIDIAGLELSPEDRELLRHPQVGGLILFTRNFEDTAQLRDLLRCVRELRPSLVVSVDHEGGRVQRFRRDFTRLPAMQSLGQQYRESATKALSQARELGWLMASELLAFDIDISFAPILDLDESFSDIIGNRAFAADPEDAIPLAEAFIDGMHEAGMACTGKHFPGHGGVKADSHLELPVDTRGLEELEAHDLRPYVALLPKLDAVMSAHICFPRADAALVSFSSFWLREYLKTRLGFQGLVFSDDLTMEGAAGAGSFLDRAQLALDAGCDALLVCNHRRGACEVIEGLEARGLARDVRSLTTMRPRKATVDTVTLQRGERWQKAVAIAEALC